MFAGLLRLVSADSVSPEQERALVAVMLGLVVFATIFLIVERRRNRRAKAAREMPGTAEEEEPPSPTVAPPPVEPRAPQLYRPPLANPEGKVPDPLPAPAAPAVAPEPLPAPVAEAPPSVAGIPASPDEIGIVIPEVQPPLAPDGPPPTPGGPPPTLGGPPPAG